MLTVHLLGSGSGLPTARRDTTSLLVRVGDDLTLVDCPGGVVHKLARLHVGVDQLCRVILTHDHVDHVYGFPHLVHALGILGNAPSLEVHAPASTCATIEKMLAVHRLDRPCYPRVVLGEAGVAVGAVLTAGAGFEIRSAPTAHGRDTIALRFDTEEASFAHSSDTSRCPDIARLAVATDLLLHDCGGLDATVRRTDSPHASARDAGEIAAMAGAAALRLLHLGSEAERDEAALVREASEVFDGPVEVGFDGAIYRLPRPDAVAASSGATG